LEKIKHIEITNFKSIKHLEINDCNKINVFIGLPNAGKSNILEALGLIGCLDYHNLNINDFVRYGKPNDLFFEGNISIGAKVIIDNNYILELMLINDLLNITYIDNRGAKQKGINKYFNAEEFKVDTSQNITSDNLNKHSIKKYIFKDDLKKKNINLLFLNYPSGENLAQIIASNPNLRNEVNEFFKQNNLKLLIEKGTSELKIFKEYQDGTVFTLPYELIADTLQRLIFYKAAIMSNQDSVLLFEEPEAHCFEPYILEFTNAVKYDENDNQFFIVTHSDYIIKEFLRDEESKENTNIYLVNNVDGETKVKLLDKNKNEDVFEYGMNIFFNFESLWETN
jgi:AAA15 family ATPase/GTPase